MGNKDRKRNNNVLRKKIMKKIIISALAAFTPFIGSATNIVIPDIELGHWETTTDSSDFIEQALASVPEASRDMVRKMMEDKMKSSSHSQQCITEDVLNNFDQQMKSALGDNKDCQLEVMKSTKTNLVAAMNCPGSAIQINTRFINPKYSESVVISHVDGMGATKIKMSAKWKSNTCPAGI